MHGKQTGLLCPAWLIAGRKTARLKLLPIPAGRKQTNRCTEIMRTRATSKRSCRREPPKNTDYRPHKGFAYRGQTKR